LGNASGGIEPSLSPPDEICHIHPTAPAIRLDATGAFDLCGDIDFHTMNDHKVVLVIREIGILF
jgi:hypothetical protein